MSGSLNDLSQIISDIRRCFWLLGAISDEMVADLGLTAATRAVLEHLETHGPETVPRIAHEKSVRRQSIQAHVDQLREAGFVAVKPNPAHRRSVLVTSTDKGRAAFAEAQSRERLRLANLITHLDGADLHVAAAALASLRVALRSRDQGALGDAA